jgi:RNA recognition motif-containing protein
MTSIFVAKLDFGVTNEQLRQLFEQHGSVIKVNVATDRETGKSRGFAFVEMANRDEAMNAIEALNGHMINGRDIAVKEAEQRGDTRPNNNPRSTSDFQRPSSPRTDDRRPASPSLGSDTPLIIPPIDSLKTEPRKKVNKDRKPGDSDSDNRNKKPKMDAYKKSGKMNRFFDDDDDDDFDDDLFSYKKRDEEEDFDEDDDEDFA